MFFFPKRNRRRIDVAKKTGEFKAAAKLHAPVALKLAVSVAISAGLVWGGLQGWRWATTSPTFALTDIAVHGATRATDVELIRLGGLVPGLNLVSLDAGGVEREIARHPWVKSVKLTRRFPSRLQVEVVEFQPVALAALGDQLYLVDASAAPFKRVQASEAMDLPLITGVEREALATAREESVKRLARGVEVLTAYAASEASRGQPLSEVHVDADAVSLITAEGQEVLLGDGDLDAKLQRLVVARRELAQRKVNAAVIRLDNRVRPGWVTVQVAGAGLTGSKATLVASKGVAAAPGVDRSQGKSSGASERNVRTGK